MSGNSPISGTFAATITGTYVVASGTTDTVVYDGATFGNGTSADLVGGGTLESSGSVTVNFDYGTPQLGLGGGITWENSGTVVDNGVLQFGTVAGDSATIINEAGAVFDLTSGDSDLEANGSGIYSFVNDGTLEQTINGNNSVAEAVTNVALVSSDSGDLYLDGPTTNSGTIQSDGGFLEIMGGVLGGTIQNLGGNVALVGTYTSTIDTTDTVTFGGAYFGWGGDGAAVLAGPGTLLTNGYVTIDFDYGTPQLQLTGGMTWDNAGTVYDNGDLQFGTAAGDSTSATIVNQIGALFDLTSSESDLQAAGTGTYGFVNDGTLEQTVNSSNAISVPLSNAGLVSGDSGNLYLAGQITNSGTIQSDGGFVELQGGVLGGTIQSLGGNIALVGAYASAIDTTETVTFGGAYLGWAGDGDAVLTGPGTLASYGYVTVDFDYGTTQLQLADGITWDNAGTVYDNGVVLFGTGSLDSATLINQAGALFDLTASYSDLEANSSGSYIFDNYGTLEETGNNTDVISVPLNNADLVSGDAGLLDLTGPVTNSGTIQADDGSVQLYGGVLGGTIQSVGTTGGIALMGTYTLAAGPIDTVTFGGAALGANGVAAVLAGPGTLVTNGAVSVTFDYGTVQLQLADGITWDNNGTVTDSGVVQFGGAAGDSATLVNEVGAVFDLTASNSDLVGNGTGTYSFDNDGILEETGNNTDYVYVPLNNTGLVSVDAGSLNLEGPVTNSGTIQSDNASIELYGGVLGGTIQTIGTTGGIALVGTYVSINSAHGPADNSVTFGGAALGADGVAAVLAGPGTLLTDGSESVTFDYGTVQLQLADGITWDNAGTVTDNGVVQFGGSTLDAATLVNEVGAVVDLTAGASDLVVNGTGTYSFDNEGTLEQTGNNNDYITMPLDNTGLVSGDSGTLSLDGPVTNSGTILADGGSVDMSGGVLGGTLEAMTGSNVVLGGTYTSADGTTDTVAFDNVTFTGVVLAGPGTLASSGNASVTSDYSNVELVLTDGITWDDSGSITDNGVVQFGTAAGDSATLVNEAGAVIDLTQGGGSNIITGGAGTYSLVNAGLLDQTGGGTVNIGVAIDDTSTGTIDASSGNLTFTAGGSIAGLVEGNNTVNFDGGNVTLAATGDITVNTINFDPNTLYMDGGTISSPNLTIAAGDEVIGYGTLDNVQNNGTIIADGGVLVITGNVTGSGVFESQNGGALAFTGTVAGTYTNTGVLELDNNATLTTTAGFINSGDVYVNNAGSGGGALTVGGTLTNSNYVEIGNYVLATTLTAQGLDNTGQIDIDGGDTTEQATLSIAADAPATWTGIVNVRGDGLLEFGGTSGIGTIASGAQINLSGLQAVVAASGLGTTSDTALAGLAVNAGQLDLVNGASLTTTGGLVNSGDLYLDNNGNGGSSLAIDGTLTNSNYVEVGDYALATTLTAQGLDNTGQIDIDGGDATEQATLSIAADAPATWTGIVNVRGDGLLEFGGTSGIGTIASGAQINLSGLQAVVAASGLGTTSDTALAGLAVNAGQLDLVNGASLTTTGGLVNSGDLYLDNNGNGGSSLAIDGTLTNSNYVVVGDYTLATTLTAQALAGTGQIDIDGGDATEQATLSIAADAPATWTGIVNVRGNGLLEFGGIGGIGTIAGGAQINLSGSQAVVAASGLGTTTDTALTGLTANAGQLDLVNGASLTITGGLVNSGDLYLDNNGSGGSSLAIEGTLTNSGDVYIGNGGLAAPTTLTVGALANTGYISVIGNYGTATAGATLDVNTIAGFGTAGVLTGSVFIDGYGVIEFTGGHIGTVAGGASLELRNEGELADAGSLGSSSALTGLTENDGNLAVRYGDAISLTGNLRNTGNFYLQDEDNDATVSVNSIAGTLTNSGDIYMGNLGLTAPTTLTVGALVNTGYLSVVGDSATATQGATLDVNTIAGFGTAGVLTGSVYIDGTGVIAFTGDQIGTIASGAQLELRYLGELADAGNLGRNSALTGLTENDGNFAVRYGNAISLTGNLLNTGNFYLQDEDNNSLVSNNTIAGTLTNTGGIYFGNSGLSAPTTLTVGALVNTGYISVVGDSATATQGATLDVNTIAGFGTAGVLTGSVYIDGTGVIAFTGDQIGTIASGAQLELRYLGELADAGNLGSNSALAGLTENDGNLAVRYGNAISLTGNLLNTGNFYLQDEDNNALISNNTIAGTLTNTGGIYFGNSGLSAPTTLIVGALNNSNYLSIAGNTSTASDGATLTVDGAASSSGTTNIDSNAAVDVAGANTYTVTGGDTDVAGLLAAGTIVVDPVAVAGGVLQLSGGTLQAASLTITSGATLLGFGTVQPAITSDGVIEAAGGSLDLQGGLAAPATVVIENASALELAGADSGIVDFAGPNGTFVLDDPIGFSGTIGGLALGDTLVLNDTTATIATPTFDSVTDTSTLAISLAGGGTIDLTLAGNYAGETFSVNQAGTNSEVAPIGTAAGTIITATPINFGEAHAGTTVAEPLEIMNNGPVGAAALDVTIGALSGDATASGSITELAPQATDSTDLSVGINSNNIGMQTGTVTLDFASDVGGGNTSPLPSQSVGVSGTVYGYANPTVTAPTNVVLHVGDDGGTATEALTVANSAPTSHYYEGLDAAATGAVTGNLISASGSTGDIAAGSSDSSSVTVSFSTATAGYVTGTAIVALTSDGTGVDTLGLTPLDGATYSAVNNFSTVSNANGVWSYQSNGTLLADSSSGSNYEEWSNGGSQPNEAFVTLNPTTTTQTYSGTVVLPPSYLDLDPQDAGNAAVQFTAPTAGVYTFTGNFLGVDTGERAHAVAIDINGTAVAGGTISSYGQTIAIDLTATLAAGSTVDFASDTGASYNNLGTGLSLIVTTAAGDAVPVTAVIDNYVTAAIQQAGSTGLLGQVGNTYTLDLGTFANGVGTVSDTLDVANTAAGPADWLSGSLIASGDAAFGDTGLGTFGTLGAGGTTPFSVDLSTTNAGVFTQTITLDATDSNASGYSEALAGETIDVVGTVLSNAQLAQPVINTATPIVLADAHVATGGTPTDQTDLSISNTGSATLSASVGGVTGTAYGTGSFSQLAPGKTDTTGIAVGVNNTSAGTASGDVTIDFQSGADLIALNPQTIAVSGNVYRLAAARVAGPSNVILHVGDGGGTETEALTVINTDPADHYSEGLEVTALGSAGGDVSGASGTTGDIAAQGINDTSLTVSISTASAATSGTVAMAETSDGTDVDTLGTTSLGTVDVPINVSVNNYATAAVEQLGGEGTLTPSGVANTYTLDLGSTEQYSSALTADLGPLNAAQGPAADVLDGNFSIGGDSEFADTGFGSFNGVTFGNADGGNDVVLNTGTIGTFTQQIVLDPTGSNASGYSGTLTAETIDVVGTIVPVPPPPPPPLPVAIAWGDVHLTTFDGLYYNFQAEGEFVLAQSTVAGDTFQVQARLQPWSANSTVSVMTMLAAEVGTDRVTFGLGRNDVVSVNGAPVTFAGNGASIELPGGGGTVTQVSSTSYQVAWNTGEVMDVTDGGNYFNMNLTLSASDGPGSIQGLLGSDSGQANDFVANGTVLAQPLSSSTLYGEFADAWRVTDSTSLMDYLAGQTTATFTDDNFPADSISVNSLPAAIYAEAQQEVIQAGITNPNLQAAAIIDLLVTGDPNSLLDDLDINQNGEVTDAAVINSPAPPVPALGVSAVATNVIENAGGTTTVTFTAYLTNATGTDTVIDWAVTAPNATFLGATNFGGTLPSGFVVVPAGQTTTNFTVSLPTDVLGTNPSSNLQVTIATTNGDPIFGQTAQTEIDNFQPEPGNPVVPVLTLLSGAGTFSGNDGNYTLNVGTLVAGEQPLQDRFQFSNDALAPSDLLTGSIAASGSGFTVYGDQPLTPLAAGSSYQGLVLETDSGQTGPQTETIVISPVDENITGYSSIMPSQTVTITDTVLPDAVGDLLTSGPINLGTFYQGDFAETALSIMNAATAGSAGLDVTTAQSGQATATGAIDDLAPGATNSSGIIAGIDTSSPGVQTGTITLNYASDAGNGNTAANGSAQIEVIGTVYGPATAEVAASPIYVHIGDNGGSVTVPITVSNTAPNNGFAENLDAEVVGFGTYVTAASGSIVDLMPQISNDTSLTATLSDANYGTYAGEVAIDLQSDGTGIDSEGTTSLGIAYVQAVVDVDQYAAAAMEEISGNGTMVPTGVATNYVLDLGTVAQYATPLGANLGVLNDVLGQSDLLGGSFTISGAPEFENIGFTPFGSGTETAGLAAQEVDSDPVVVLSSGTVGTFTETVTLDPIGYNPGGYSGTLTPETVTITGTVVAAPPPVPVSRVSDAWGDVHLTTFDGLYYNFQAQGEFVLTESTIPGDTFAIQARMQPWSIGSSVSVNTMIAAEVGSDHVTFAIDRPDTVWIDGVAQTMSSPVINLADGTLEQTAANSYELIWNTGEELQITDNGTYLNATVSLPNSDAGNVQGLLGPDNGNPADDLELPGGTPIATGGTVTYAELYGQFANAWRVTDATSLMDYSTGQDTASFTNVNFPYNQISLGNLPANAVALAEAAAEAAGITDPNLLQAAVEDYLFTGNPDALEASENVQEQEGTTNSTAQTLTAPPPVVANIGVEANVPTMMESATIPEAVGFTIYLTSPEANATTVDFEVTDPGPGFLSAADFGGVLPSGTVTIQAGQTTALFTVELPAAALGSQADENLQVTISPQGGETVFAPQAQTEILNTGPTAGNPATPLAELLSGDGSLTGSGTAYELNLGSVEQYSDPLLAGYGVENGGIVPSDLLSGSFEVSGSSQFLNSGLSPFATIAAGAADTAPEVELLTNDVGTFTENVTLTPTDSNLTNYSSVMSQVTIEVVGTIAAPPLPPPPPESEATAWGDVHITTFDGVYYNFQAAGEYVLTRSTVAGDAFQVQARLQPWTSNSSVTVQTQVGAAIGSDDVVFALTGAGLNDSPLYLNGTAEVLGVGQTLSLSDGSVTETSDNTYRVNWNTGETMTVTLDGTYISDTIELTGADAGNVQGLLGPDDGNASTDLQLPSGQSIASNGTIASSTLYGVYENDWQVPSQADSLLYYTAGQIPSTFLIPGFPEKALTLSQLPANLVAAAEAIVEAEGITNPNLIDAAVIDLLVTGNPNSVFSTENVQEEGVLLSSTAVSIPTPLPSVGIMAGSTTVLEPTTGTLAVDYTIYLTAAAAQSSTIDYSVIGSGPNNLGTADIVGGTGSGVMQIAAGQTSTQIVVDVLANALGSLPDAELQVGITATGGETLFGGSAETEIVNPTPTAGNPAVALVEQLGGNGDLTGGGTSYSLNLGTQVQNGPALFAELGIENGATVPADDLSGQFSITNFTNYLNTGFDPFSNVAPGAADTEPVIQLNTGTIGVYTETVVLDPTDTNPTGYSSPMNDVTLTVTGTIVPMPLPPPPPLPTATAFGDVHLTTFDGLYYNFQAVGEFTVAKSTVAGDSFNVQIRTTQWSPGATVSVIDEVAAGIGSDRVTFGLGRTDTVYMNGTAEALGVGTTLTLAGGSVTEESGSTYVVDWNTGESMTVNLGGSYISTTVALAAQDENGNVEGLLGSDSGVDNDFEPVVSGTTITTAQLYGQFADTWRLTQADSLLDYGSGQTTATFTDLAFPSDALSFADLPTALQQEGLQEAVQAGITDPQLQQAAALDYIVTGDPDIVSAGQNVQQQGITTTDTDVTGAAVTPALGVSANNAALVEGSGDLSVGLTVYLTAAEAQATTIDYTVSTPDAAYLGASAFGGTLPSGSVTISAGQTSATFSVTVPAGVLGALPSSDLQVTITPTGSESVFAPSAQTTIVNSQVEPGTAAEPEFALLSGLGTLTHNGNAYTLDLGILQPGGTVQSLGLAIENAAALGGNALAGTLTDTSSSGFTVSGTGPLPVIAAGDSYQGLHVAVNTDSAGDNSETITFAPEDQNASGYSSDDAPLTLTITDTVNSTLAEASAVTPNPVNFGIVHVGQTVTQALSVTNTAASGSDNLDGSIGAATGAATTNSGSFTGLAAELTNSASLVVGLSTVTDGVESGTATVSLESDGTGIDSNGIVALPSQTIDVIGTVDNYATAAIAEISGGGMLSHSGDNYTLNLGTLTASSSPVDIGLGISNTATGVADLLSGNFTIVNGGDAFIIVNSIGGFINNGDTAFSGLAAGQADIAPTITLTAGRDGSFTETITLNSAGSNASGYSGTLAPETLTVSGVVVPVIVLTTHADIVNGANNVTIVAATNTLSGGDQIDGGGGTNTLELEGGGSFNLAAPAALENIQVVDATEGQSAAMPTIFLRAGTDLTLNLASNSTNPQTSGAVVHGADNNDTINLGAGEDSVQLGGAGETVDGGSGTDTYYVTAATIGGTIVGGTGTNRLDVQGGGTVVMGASITGIDNVFLLNSGTSYDVTANDTAGMVIHAGTDSATVTVGAASQSVYGSSGTVRVLATAAEAGVAVEGIIGATANDTLEITTGGTITLNSADRNITVQLDAASKLTLPTNYTVAIDGSAGNDVFVATGGVLRAGQQIDGGGGTNTLELEGGGSFNLAAPAALENIQVVDATEGQSAAMPTIFLRAGTDLTLNLASNSTNPQTSGAVVHGADNDDTINLGAGDDSVQLGGTGETVNGGSGNDIYYVTDVTIGGTIVGGTGTNRLDVQGGGTVVMGDNITGIGNVFLLNSGTSYDFTANDTAGMVIHAGTDSATITVGAASQSVYGSSGTLRVLATAAEAGVAVEGIIGATANDTLEITTAGTITLNSADRNITVQLDAASKLTLPTNYTVAIDGSAGNDVFVATAGVLRAGQQIDGGGGTNTLELEGGGSFNLAAPAALENIQVVDATEGQSAAMPTIFLRAGTDLTLNLASNSTNPQTSGAVVHGADNDDTINLGAGDDSVQLGGTGETVNGGSGNDIYYVTDVTIGGTIVGGTGTNRLDVQGGGTVVMGDNITGIGNVFLLNSGTSYDFTANDTAGMVIHAGTDSATITVGAASQSVYGSSGTLRVLATAAEAGVAVEGIIGATANDTLEITTGGTIALNSADRNITVQLDAASKLTLNHMEFIHGVGSGGNDVIIAGAAGQVLTGGGANDILEDAGHYGVTFQDTVAGFAGDTLADFSKVDKIDITNLGSVTAAPVYDGTFGPSGSGVLAVTNGIGTVDIKMSGLTAGGTFGATTDGHGGTLISYT